MSPHADFERDALALPLWYRRLWNVSAGKGAYAMPCAGACMGPGYPEQMVAVVDPHAHPRPGDLVVVWTRVPEGFVHVVTADRREVLPAHESELDVDEDLRAIIAMKGTQVLRPSALPFAKLLVRPIPPVGAWTRDRDVELVVQQLAPQLEIRTDLAEVLAVDRVVALVELVDASGRRVRRLPMPVASARPIESVRWTAEEWAWGEEGAPALAA